MNTPINPKTLTLEQLKSMCYDELVQVEIHQKNLQVLNTEIANRLKPQTTPSINNIEEAKVTEVPA